MHLHKELQEKTKSIWRLAGQKGASTVEFALGGVILATVFVFVLDAGLVLHHYSRLTDVTNKLTRAMANRLGRSSNPVAGSYVQGTPWFGSCDEFLEDVAEDFLGEIPPAGDHSITDNTKPYYYGETLKKSPQAGVGALIADPNSPYSILRVTSKLKPICVICTLFDFTIDYESALVLEFYTENCNDYSGSGDDDDDDGCDEGYTECGSNCCSSVETCCGDSVCCTSSQTCDTGPPPACTTSCSGGQTVCGANCCDSGETCCGGEICCSSGQTCDTGPPVQCTGGGSCTSPDVSCGSNCCTYSSGQFCCNSSVCCASGQTCDPLLDCQD